MVSCANGASVAPNWTAENVALSTVGAEIATAAGFPELVPFLLAEPIIGTIAANALCALNPDDPGDFQLSMLNSPATPQNPPLPTSPPGSMSRWIWDKTLYFFFQRACVCNVTNAKPPAPISITAISNVDTSVNLAVNQSQLSVVINNQNGAAASLQELYNMLQHGNSLAGDLWNRSVPSQPNSWLPLATGLSGEGALTLPVYPPSVGNFVSTHAIMLRTQIRALGPKIGIRGTRNPRLYGVGSLFYEYDAFGPDGTTTFGRTSIHYHDQTFRVPTDMVGQRVAYRLMPGNVIDLYYSDPRPDNVMTINNADTRYGWIEYGNYSLPPSWSDPPIYPNPTRRVFPVAGGSEDYLRLDSRPLAVPEKILTDIPGNPKGCGCPGSV